MDASSASHGLMVLTSVGLLVHGLCAQAPIGSVLTEHKVSSTAGGLVGPLDDFDVFGYGLAVLGDLSGDGTRELAVGAVGDDDGAGAAGAVWLLSLTSSGSVAAQQKLSATQGGFAASLDAGDSFGCSLAPLGDLDGDGVGDLAVGAFLDDDGGSDRGAVHVLFLAADGTVAHQTKISATAGGFGGALDANDWFGWSVASLGDLDGDGLGELAVGAYQDDDGGPERGAVWVLFLNADGTVRSEQKISDTAGGFTGVLDDGDFFGMSVAGLGDLDGDGVPDLAVGANQDDDGGLGRGALWILRLDTDGTVKSHGKISSTSGGFSGSLDDLDNFGKSVARLGDLDGDGVQDLAAGAYRDDDGGPGDNNRGALWVLLLRADGSVKFEQKLSATQGGFGGVLDPDDRFAWACAPLGDLDGDGAVDVAVGAHEDDDGGSNRGAVWLLQLAGASAPWASLGGGTPGSHGTPTLAGSGPLTAGSSAGLSLTHAPPGALLLAWLAFSSTPAPFFGGTIHALPFSRQFLFVADGSGAFAVSTTWPAGVPAASEAIFQFLVADGSVLWGITLSNALLATTP